jgi:hypothetical protein
MQRDLSILAGAALLAISILLAEAGRELLAAMEHHRTPAQLMTFTIVAVLLGVALGMMLYPAGCWVVDMTYVGRYRIRLICWRARRRAAARRAARAEQARRTEHRRRSAARR